MSADLAYDMVTEEPGSAIGAGVNVSKGWDVLAEHYPVVFAGNTTGCFGSGIKFETYGHQFIFRPWNSASIGARRLMQGQIRRTSTPGLNS
ncbi:MAG: hypothetical protein LLG37_11130 [Spirochaetia bacterium]|nr:hypothetical protein [Spirochaetia bacterium]